MKIVIVGGGIGGLSAARELSLRGLKVTVLERAEKLNPVGAGIIMNPNAMGVLERNGLADAVRRESWPYLVRETRDPAGRLLATRDYRPLYESGKLAQGALVHRAHLLDVLFQSLPAGTVQFGKNISSVREVEADLVIGADGIRSQVRRELFGEFAPRYMGYRSHRLIMDNLAEVKCFTEYLGRGQRIGLVPISASRLYVWTTFNSRQRQEPSTDLARMFSRFTHAPVRRVLEARHDNVIVTEIEELWSDDWIRVSGHLTAVLLGDAAHAMTPNIGQGAGMAMEDAAVLAEELASGKEIEHALSSYAQRRKPRVQTVMRVSRQVGEDGQKWNPFSCWLRNRRVEREGRDVQKSLADLERLLSFSR